jgi:hypothetical protein
MDNLPRGLITVKLDKLIGFDPGISQEHDSLGPILRIFPYYSLLGQGFDLFCSQALMRSSASLALN